MMTKNVPVTDSKVVATAKFGYGQKCPLGKYVRFKAHHESVNDHTASTNMITLLLVMSDN